jgi:hypothetical protein
VVAASILLNLTEAVRAQANKVGILLGPGIVLLSIEPLKANSALLSHHSSGELLLATIRINAKAVVLNEVATSKRARGKLAIDLKVSKSLVKSKPIELIPGELIDKGLDLLVVDNLHARKVRALNSYEVVDSHNKGNIFPSDSRDLVVKARSLINLDAKVGSNATSAESMATVKLGRIAIELSEADAALVLGAAGLCQKGEVE